MRPLIVGNWKMHGSGPLLVQIELLAASLQDAPPRAEVLICPPSTLIERMAGVVRGHIAVGGQNCHHEMAGAFTGDLSAEMLKDAGASAVIVGHSERRQHHGETDAMVADKGRAALRAGLTAIVCIGETQAQRQAGKALTHCGEQIAQSVPDGMSAATCAIGYEPLWAIGSGQVPDAEQITEMHAHIRRCLVSRLGADGDAVRILYGGSVKPDNAQAILALPHVGGALVGGASLDATQFEAIVRAVP